MERFKEMTTDHVRTSATGPVDANVTEKYTLQSPNDRASVLGPKYE